MRVDGWVGSSSPGPRVYSSFNPTSGSSLRCTLNGKNIGDLHVFAHGTWRFLNLHTIATTNITTTTTVTPITITLNNYNTKTNNKTSNNDTNNNNNNNDDNNI